jgi:hypothetical protein
VTAQGRAAAQRDHHQGELFHRLRTQSAIPLPPSKMARSVLLKGRVHITGGHGR